MLKHKLGCLIARFPTNGLLARMCSFYASLAQGECGDEHETDGEERVFSTLAGLVGKVVFDVGAHRGSWIKMALRHAPDKEIHCFEPSPESFEFLQSEGFPSQVILNRQGLSDEAGFGELYLTPDATHNFVQVDSGAKSERVEISTIDAYCAKKNISRVGYVKIDVEGLDYKVLVGAAGMLSKSAIDVLQFEYGERWIDSRCFLRDAYHFLEKNSYPYRIFLITRAGLKPTAYHPNLENFKLKNLACVHNELAEKLVLR